MNFKDVKLVKYLKRDPITSKDFIYSKTNDIKENVLQKNNIKQNDYKKKAILYLVENIMY